MLPHRESKDVFILGGIDDIQALLDDSMVNDSSFVKSVWGVEPAFLLVVGLADFHFHIS